MSIRAVLQLFHNQCILININLYNIFEIENFQNIFIDLEGSIKL